MEWQHWLDPVGQYTGGIIAVKSQFVLRQAAWVSVAQAFCVPQVARVPGDSQCKEASAALGGFRFARIKHERNARAIQPSIRDLWRGLQRHRQECLCY